MENQVQMQRAALTYIIKIFIWLQKLVWIVTRWSGRMEWRSYTNDLTWILSLQTGMDRGKNGGMDRLWVQGRDRDLTYLTVWAATSNVSHVGHMRMVAEMPPHCMELPFAWIRSARAATRNCHVQKPVGICQYINIIKYRYIEKIKK